MAAMEDALQVEREFSERLSVKVREQASDLQSQAEEIEWLSEYKALCEAKVMELAPGLKLPQKDAGRKGSLSPVRRAFGLGSTPSFVVSMSARHRSENLVAGTQINRLEKRAAQAEERAAELSRQANEARKSLEAKEKELMSSQLKRERLQDKVDASEAARAAAEEYSHKLEFKFQTHNRHALLKKSAQLQLALDEALAGRADLEARTAEAETESRELREMVEELSKSFEGEHGAGAGVRRLQHRSDGDGQAMMELQAAMEAAREELRRMSAHEDGREAQLAAHTVTVDKLNVELGRLRQQLQAAEEDKGALMDHVEELAGGGGRLGRVPEGAGAEELRQAVRALEGELAAREGEMEEMCRIHEELLSAVREQQAEDAAALEELRGHVAAHQEGARASVAAVSELEGAREELEGAREGLGEAQARCAELEEMLSDLRAQSAESLRLSEQLEGDLVEAQRAVEDAARGQAAAQQRAADSEAASREKDALLAAKESLLTRMEMLMVQSKVDADSHREGAARRDDEVTRALRERCSAAEEAAEGGAEEAARLGARCRDLESRAEAAEEEARRLAAQLREREGELTRKGVELARAQQDKSRTAHELEHAEGMRADLAALAAEFCGGAGSGDAGSPLPPGTLGPPPPGSPMRRMWSERTALYKLRALCESHSRRQREHAESRARLEAKCDSLLAEKHALAVDLAKCQQHSHQVAEDKEAALHELALLRRRPLRAASAGTPPLRSPATSSTASPMGGRHAHLPLSSPGAASSASPSPAKAGRAAGPAATSPPPRPRGGGATSPAGEAEVARLSRLLAHYERDVGIAGDEGVRAPPAHSPARSAGSATGPARGSAAEGRERRIAALKARLGIGADVAMARDAEEAMPAHPEGIAERLDRVHHAFNELKAM